ncbi:DUF1189 domain-containing protein [bacterium 1XD21-13]|nr:DUF1189 domain-containing protein [bacterium 1XD21-13]
MNVFKEMVCSVGRPSAYPEFLKNKKGKIFGYGMLLMLFYFLLSTILPFLVFQLRTGGIGKIVNEALPDFEMSDRGFWIEEPFYYEDGNSYFELDSDHYFDEEAAYQFSAGYQNMLLVDEEKLIVKSNGQVQTLYFYMLESGTYFSKQSILAIIPMIYLLLILGLIFYFAWITALFFFGVLMVSLVGMILNAILKTELTFGQIFILGIYGRTLPLFFKGLVLRFFNSTVVPIHIPYFWVINFGVTLVYMFLAMRRIGEQRVHNMQYTYQQPYQQGMYQQGGYGQNGYQQDPYQQNPYQQNIYQQNPYNQDYQGQSGYYGQRDSQGQENSRNDYGEH